jgi:hypothetical protein
MTNTVRRAVVCAALAVSAMAGQMLAASGASAAQPWTCICKGEPKRFLASTRHCEFQNKIPKGAWCSKRQFQAVYGPACRAEGCKLAPLD